MPRRKKLTPAEQAQKELEALNSSVRIDGKGEAPVVQALLSQNFLQDSNLDAAGIALALQEIIRGQQSLVAQNSEQIAILRERQDRIDQEMAERFENQQKFIDEVLDRAEKLQRRGEERDKLIAQGVQQYQEAKQIAVAEVAVKKIAFEQQLAKEEKVMVVSPGVLITAMEAGQQVAKIIAEEVRIRHKVWYLQPGVPTMVPKSVKEYIDQRRASQAETLKRQELLTKKLEAPQLAAEWNKIGGTDTMPTA